MRVKNYDEFRVKLVVRRIVCLNGSLNVKFRLGRGICVSFHFESQYMSRKLADKMVHFSDAIRKSTVF